MNDIEKAISYLKGWSQEYGSVDNIYPYWYHDVKQYVKILLNEYKKKELNNTI